MLIQERADRKVAIIARDDEPGPQRNSDPRPPARPTHMTSNGVIPLTPNLD
jgi:hypothetical protein